MGYPSTGDGDPIEIAIDTTNNSPIPDRLFWRVSVVDSDQDNDGLTDWEENALGTNPGSPDSDGDGVSDLDELAVDFTNPLSAADLDGDGIPDDFEKHLAAQLLAYIPDAAHWGSTYDDLVAGNLDPNYQYTNDGISALALANALKPTASTPYPSSGYFVKTDARENELVNGFYNAGSPPTIPPR